MIDINSDIVYNLNHIVIVSTYDLDLIDSFKYMFDNVVKFDNNENFAQQLTHFLKRNNIKKLILVNYCLEYDYVLKNLDNNIEVYSVFTKSFASLSNQIDNLMYEKIINLYKKNQCSKIAVIDEGVYSVLYNKGYHVYKLNLDNEFKNTTLNSSNSIGLLNNQGDARHSFYNELSAVKLNGKYACKIYKPTDITQNFVSEFNIKHEFKNEYCDVLNNNVLNLYINFTNNNPLVFLESMDLGIPCILGNNDILPKNKKLYDMLVVESDDDVTEISKKIDEVIQNKDSILKEYEKFRNQYHKDSKKLVSQFVGNSIVKNSSNEYEYLLTVVVPVYNVEGYIEACLNSILAARIDNMEILIINDGSKDNSEEKILPFVSKYPDLIKYIKQENHGLGNVRNVGLQYAKGKYIASIDSDDTINNNFFTEAIEYLENDIDIVMYDWLTVTNESKFETVALDYVFRNLNKYQGLLYTTIMPSACNKIIKKSLYDELDLNFIEDKFEDLSTNPFILLRAETIKYINKPYYQYYIRSNSIMRTKPGYSMIDIIKKVDERLKKYKEYINVDIDTFKFYTYSWRIEEYIINQLYDIDENEIDKFIKYIYDNLRQVIIDVFENKLYQKQINTIKNDEDKEYIINRNKAFKAKKLGEFIKESRRNKKYYKITPALIYYGDK